MDHEKSYLNYPGAYSGPIPVATVPTMRSRRTQPLPVHDTTWSLPGFCGNAKVTTSFGDLPIQALRLNDPLRTVSGTLATVTWIDKICLDEEFLRTHPDARPLVIRAGALGHGRPRVDMVLSPHQMVNVSRGQYRPEFRLARELEDLPGVLRKPETMVTYYLFHCTLPVAVTVDGVFVRVTA